MSIFTPVWIHPSLRAESLAQKKRQSLLSGEIDHGFHYQGHKQSELWLKVHQRHAPVLADPAFSEIYQAVAAEIAEELAGKAVHVIGLCAGGGWKEAAVLEALDKAGCRLRYTPVDTSLELVLRSVDMAGPWLQSEMLPVVGDISLLRDLPEWLEQFPGEETRLYTFFGAVHNFLPSFIFPLLRDVLREQDNLLLSVNLAPAVDESETAYSAACGKILPQYDNAETLAWLRQILVDWGVSIQLSEPCIQVQKLEDLLGFIAFSTWLADASFPWQGEICTVRHGERIRLFFSLRYTLTRLEAKLCQNGLVMGAGQVTPCGQEGVWRISRFMPPG